MSPQRCDRVAQADVLFDFFLATGGCATGSSTNGSPHAAQSGRGWLRSNGWGQLHHSADDESALLHFKSTVSPKGGSMKSLPPAEAVASDRPQSRRRCLHFHALHGVKCDEDNGDIIKLSLNRNGLRGKGKKVRRKSSHFLYSHHPAVTSNFPSDPYRVHSEQFRFAYFNYAVVSW